MWRACFGGIKVAFVAIASLAAAPRSPEYQLNGRIDPPTAVAVLLHGAIAPFESSTMSGEDGRFQFGKVPLGTYTLVVATAARGDLVQTIELSPGTVDSKGHFDIVLKVDASRLESRGDRSTRATISATVLSIPDRAIREYADAQHCLSRGLLQGDSACAVVHLGRAVEIAPQFTAAWNQLGTLAYQAHRYSDAEAKFRRALEADSEAFEPLVNLGGVLLNLGRPEEALGYNERAVARRPNDALANSQLGLSYVELNDSGRAEQFLKIAIQLDPAHFSHPQLTLAQIYARRGDRESAVAQLRDFLARHPDSPQTAEVQARIAQLSR